MTPNPPSPAETLDPPVHPPAGLDRLVRWIPAALIVLLVATAFLSAPWRLQVINDEMLHLESWRNRYDEPIVYPLVMERLRSSGRISPQRYEQIEQLFIRHRWLQRVLVSQLGEGFPPLYAWLAELMAALSDSNLAAMRSMSVAGAVLCLVSLYMLGRQLHGHGLGCWLAALQAICYLTQVYAGIGRGYALGQGTLALTLWQYARCTIQGRGRASVLASALLAQSLVWMNWLLLFPIVLHVVVDIYRANPRPVAALFRSTWWYVLGSLAMMPFLVGQFLNPTVVGQKGSLLLDKIYTEFSWASPFGHLLGFGALANAVQIVVLLAGTVIGIGVIWRASWGSIFRWGIMGAASLGGLTPILWGPLDRRLMSWMLVLGIFCATGLWSLFGRERIASYTVLSAILFGFLGVSLFHPLDPYKGSFRFETDYRSAAGTLRDQLSGEDVWMAYPYFCANPLYPYAGLPTPLWPMSLRELDQAIDRPVPGAGEVYLWTTEDVEPDLANGIDPVRRAMALAEQTWRFPNGFVLLKLPKPAQQPLPSNNGQ